MAVAFGTISTATINQNFGDASKITITKPTSTAEGDLLVAILGYTVGNDEGLTFSLAGWTSHDQLGIDNQIAYQVLVKVAGASEPADYTFDKGGGELPAICGAILRITGDSFAGTGNIVDTDSDTATSVGSGTETFSGGVTPGDTDTLLILGTSAGDFDGAINISGYAVANNNPSWTERADLADDDGSEGVNLGIATATYSVGTATGDYTVSFSLDPDNAVGFILSITESTNVTVNAGVLSASSSIQPTTQSGKANVSAGVMSAASSLQGVTLSTFEATQWTLESDPSNPTWTNEPLI